MIDERYMFRGKRIDNGEWVTGCYCKQIKCVDEGIHVVDVIQIVCKNDMGATVTRTFEVYPAMVEPVAVKVIIETEDDKGVPYEFIHVRCPNCENIISQMYKRSKEPRSIYLGGKYCCDCGQRLDWSEFLKGSDRDN